MREFEYGLLVGIESLILNVPFVCKSWYKASLSHLCWQRLVFPRMPSPNDSFPCDGFTPKLLDKYKIEGEFSVTSFIKSIVKRSDKSTTFLALPVSCTEEALFYVADECPNLRALCFDYEIIPKLMSKWKALEILVLGSNLEMEAILAETVIHCKNLLAFAVISGYIEERHASAIVNLLPNIKRLSLRHAHMARENLVMILKGCKELEYLDVSFCEGFDKGDGEILKLASHISTFKDKGSSWDDYYCQDDCCSFRYNGFC
ncbi:hypothetical protein HYC85_026837 [Camellia sinensis]|uniref:F-box domain-containing protein n=1 Tax=Camellia sinensis TaxID=4442 RepID=A0A7J7G8C8_CAMSI|nr:hypothetical protein HYC85_026837 [Camellia sinensis]